MFKNPQQIKKEIFLVISFGKYVIMYLLFLIVSFPILFTSQTGSELTIFQTSALRISELEILRYQVLYSALY